MVVILCGGQGWRIKGYFENIPKSLIEVQGKPLLKHIIESYQKFGLNQFLLLVGNNEDQFQNFAQKYSDNYTHIEVCQTGIDSPTGGRLKKAESRLKDFSSFYLTYGDGIADVNFDLLKEFHSGSGKLATMTVVRPVLPFGFLELGNDNEVISFQEKPVSDKWVNGGFFRLNKEIFSYLEEDSDFEVEILAKLSAIHQLNAYLHTGYWKNLDTYKDYLSFQNDIKNLIPKS